MAVEVSLMQRSDIDGVITCIQTAFAEDPYKNWVFDRSAFNPVRNRVSLRLRCLWGIKHGHFLVARDSDTSQIVGCAMWLPPSPLDAPQSWSLWLSSWLLWAQQGFMNLVYGRGGLIVRRYWIWKSQQAMAQQALWTDPAGYWFCNIVTVLPGHQGKGIGRVLMDEVLLRADRTRHSCYLESSRMDPNVRIYERMGFKLVRTLSCVDESDDKEGAEGITLYCMLREPRDICGSDPILDV